MDLSHLVALAAALGWASGLRLYAVVFFTGAAGFMGWVPLPAGLQMLQNPVLLGASFLLLLWLAWEHPMWFWPVLALAVVLALVLVVVLFKFLRALLRRFSQQPQAAT